MDFNRAAMLLHIVDTARQWPNLAKLHNAAMNELLELQDDKPQPKAIPSTDPITMERKI